MAYTIIPLQPQANQTFSCVLDGQQAIITLETTDYGLFMTAAYSGVSIATSRLCLDRTDVNAARYLGLPQALFFADLQGITDPVYTGFGTRYVLCYGDPPAEESVGGPLLFMPPAGVLGTFILGVDTI